MTSHPSHPPRSAPELKLEQALFDFNNFPQKCFIESRQSKALKESRFCEKIYHIPHFTAKNVVDLIRLRRSIYTNWNYAYFINSGISRQWLFWQLLLKPAGCEKHGVQNCTDSDFSVCSCCGCFSSLLGLPSSLIFDESMPCDYAPSFGMKLRIPWRQGHMTAGSGLQLRHCVRQFHQIQWSRM